MDQTDPGQLPSLLEQLSAARRLLPKVAGVLPEGPIDPNVKLIEALKTKIECILSGQQEVRLDCLKKCVELQDISYAVEYYYPPAGVGGMGETIVISFEDVRQSARKRNR